MGDSHGMKTHVGRISNECPTNVGRYDHGMVTEWSKRGNVIERGTVTEINFSIFRNLDFKFKFLVSL